MGATRARKTTPEEAVKIVNVKNTACQPQEKNHKRIRVAEIAKKLRFESTFAVLFGLMMANADTIQVSSLPLPPAQYINLYTDENIRKNRAPKPPPPIQDSYTMFGNPFSNDDNIIRPLEAQGFKRLYPQHFDRRKELKKLNHSLLVNFLDLIDLLVHYPDSPRRAEKVLRILGINPASCR